MYSYIYDIIISTYDPFNGGINETNRFESHDKEPFSF